MLRCGIAVDQRQHAAHPAAVIGKLVVELTQQAADVGGPIDQGHPVAELGQIQGGPDAAYAGPHNQRFTDFSVHEVLRSLTNQKGVYHLFCVQLVDGSQIQHPSLNAIVHSAFCLVLSISGAVHRNFL